MLKFELAFDQVQSFLGFILGPMAPLKQYLVYNA